MNLAGRRLRQLIDAAPDDTIGARRSALEPKPVWSRFDAILTMPRASKDEDRMRRHVLGGGSTTTPEERGR